MQAILAIENATASLVPPADAGPLSLRIEGRIARLALSDHRRGNLLTHAVAAAFCDMLAALKLERTVELVVIEGEAGVFCSGPDLPAIHRARTDGTDAGRAFARIASQLVLDIVRLGKPVLALIDGAVIGGGLALGAHATYRVVTERTRISLPQTAVGLVPDLGLSRLLARAPAGFGPYLCLSGASIGAADAIHVGFADGFIHSDRIEALCEKLANPFAGDLESILNSFATDAGESSLAAAGDGIADVFGHSSVAAIADALSGSRLTMAGDTEAAIGSGSPVAMQLALALIRQAGERRRLEDCLRAEHHFVCKLLDCGEAYEGIESRLLRTGRLPRWLAARPADVDAGVLAPFLTPLLPGDGLAPQAMLHS